jgi:hypothetical protein
MTTAPPTGLLAELISTEISPEPSRQKRPNRMAVEQPLLATPNETVPKAFERRVFNHLLKHHERLGISRVWKCENVRIDGLLQLEDGRHVAVEIKYQMNWAKACQACAQIGWYHSGSYFDDSQIEAGLVVFETFSGDWATRRGSSAAERGWSNFYAEHHQIDGIRVDLLRLRNEILTTFPDELAKHSSGAGHPHE